MAHMIRKDDLCDVTLVANGVMARAHRLVLASCSPYFRAMFTGPPGFEERRLETVKLQGLEGEALLLLIDYIYSGQIHIDEDNVQLILPAAGMLQLTTVRDACCDFLHRQLHPSNCLGIRRFADLHGCAELVAVADGFIEQNFVEVVQHEEFLTLTAAQVAQLIHSDKLSVQGEEQVYEAVMFWVRFAPPTRQRALGELMQHVRLPLLPQEFLVNRVEADLRASHDCKDLLIEAMKYHLLRDEEKTLFENTMPRAKPRQPRGKPKILMVVGGQAPKAIRSVEGFDFKKDRWVSLPDLPSRRCRAGVAVLNGQVFAVGGFNGSLRVRTVDLYDPQRDQWTQAPQLEARRSTLGVAVLNNVIYAVGGFDGATGLNTAECFDPRVSEWRDIAPMSIRRSSVGVGVLGGLLYAVGGYDGASRQCLSSVEIYDPKTDEWRPCADMISKRSGAGVGVLNGCLYAVGGHDGPVVRKSVECFCPFETEAGIGTTSINGGASSSSPGVISGSVAGPSGFAPHGSSSTVTGVWRAVPDMMLARRNAGVVAHEGRLYVVGGDDGTSNLASVEVYDPAKNEWTMLNSFMQQGRSYTGVAIVDSPF
ncbi:ring canal kelch-like [Tropilaelaps mercedesae]|uniref:Kelch-like protein diablo n=1 Tax=Tropilaelaps mercedesae TaxID=418985 RepID=A0A1V9XQI5_9ACAR|nr:ring canal kelch-like [Tropilaelaps mercedesae]